MEDILASIRRILSEDEQPAGPAADPVMDASTPPAAPPVFSLDATMLVDEPASASPVPMTLTVPVPTTVPALEPPAAMLPAPTPAAPEPDASPTPAPGMLVAPAVATAAAAAVNALARTLAAERGAAVYGGGPTIEGLVREELRPMLKEWLDLHLPALVERAVRAEIERVVGRSTS
jgi:cell pole-organizing protein PopZ